ncbi:MAG: hypothetical protein ABWZ76_02855 [Acidimicrobiales bacterium]
MRFAVSTVPVEGVLITDDDDQDGRGWLLESAVPTKVLVHLTPGDQVELVLDYDGGQCHGRGRVNALSSEAQEGRLYILGEGRLEPWPDG